MNFCYHQALKVQKLFWKFLRNNETKSSILLAGFFEKAVLGNFGEIHKKSFMTAHIECSQLLNKSSIADVFLGISEQLY